MKSYPAEPVTFPAEYVLASRVEAYRAGRESMREEAAIVAKNHTILGHAVVNAVISGVVKDILVIPLDPPKGEVP